jgi:hypothetical protein
MTMFTLERKRTEEEEEEEEEDYSVGAHSK